MHQNKITAEQALDQTFDAIEQITGTEITFAVHLELTRTLGIYYGKLEARGQLGEWLPGLEPPLDPEALQQLSQTPQHGQEA